MSAPADFNAHTISEFRKNRGKVGGMFEGAPLLLLHTSGKLADTTSGFKSAVLKALGPLLKKRSITVVPFAITGTSSDPSFALDLDAKR